MYEIREIRHFLKRNTHYFKLIKLFVHDGKSFEIVPFSFPCALKNTLEAPIWEEKYKIHMYGVHANLNKEDTFKYLESWNEKKWKISD